MMLQKREREGEREKQKKKKTLVQEIHGIAISKGGNE